MPANAGLKKHELLNLRGTKYARSAKSVNIQ